jgi:hypothetical protein
VEVTIELITDSVGTFTQSLPISSTDPKHPQVSVALSGVVEPGKLSAPREVALVAKAGSNATKTVILRNTGKGMLSGSVEAMSQDSAFSLMGGSVSFALAPGDTQPITIEYTPATPGKSSANFAVNTSPPPGSTTIVVTGSAQ